MKIIKNSIVIASFAIVTAFLSGCGGVSEAEMQELNNLRTEVTSLEQEVNTLRDERSNLERDMAEKNAKIQQCEKDKEETRANLDKLPK